MVIFQKRKAYVLWKRFAVLQSLIQALLSSQMPGWNEYVPGEISRADYIWVENPGKTLCMERGLFRKSDTGIRIWREFNSKSPMVVLIFSVFFHICMCMYVCKLFKNNIEEELCKLEWWASFICLYREQHGHIH